MDKETLQKIRSCKALKGKTIMDVLSMPRFLENLSAYWTAQRTDRDAIRKSYAAMRKMGGAKGYKIPAHAIDGLVELSAEDIAVEYGKVIMRNSTRNYAERRYIEQIGRQAYNLTIAQLAIEEFPELKPVLLPQTKSN